MANRKGFTLIELLIVISIVAILAVGVLIVLNPSELIAQGRDSRRLADLRAIQKAIEYMIFVSTYRYNQSLTFGITATCSTASSVTSPFSGGGSCTSDTGRDIDGSGWVGIDLTLLDQVTQADRVLKVLPIDPLNNATYFYAYQGNNGNKTYELDMKLESAKYSPRMATDNGDNANFYEVGTALNL